MKILAVVILSVVLLFAKFHSPKENKIFQDGGKNMQTVTELNGAKFSETLSANTLVLVDFFATWCGPCKMFAPVLEQLKQRYEGRLVVLKVDIDENEELASEYSISSVPTIILFKNGEVLERTSGLVPLETLSQMIDKALN